MIRFRNRLRVRFTYANVVATLALFVALASGTAFAARAVIDGRNLKNGSVSGAKLAKNAVTGAQVKNRSLTATDLSASTIRALKGQKGDQGAPGAAGTNGAPGANGTNGAPGLAGSARAVAVVYGNTGDGCTVLAANSRGAASCAWNGEGRYDVTLASGVSLSGTYPTCSVGNNGGITMTTQYSCVAWIENAGSGVVAVQVYSADETATDGVVRPDLSMAAPAVVVVP